MFIPHKKGKCFNKMHRLAGARSLNNVILCRIAMNHCMDRGPLAAFPQLTVAAC